MAVTIRDIAMRAGVSVSTASRALNKRPDVSREARERVLQAARDLNYAVNLHARALTGATSKTLGFIIFNTSTAFHAAMARGVEDVATAHGYSMIVCNTGGNPELEMKAHRMLWEKRVDGVLINSVQSGSATLRWMVETNTPFVLLNRRLDDIDCDYVMVDFRRGTYMATTYLLSLGHRRILFQGADPNHPPVRERLLGYRQALEEYNVLFDPLLIIYSGDEITSAYWDIYNAMTTLRPRPTAILAYNDLWAIPVLKALSDLSLNVPTDVAVIGHNDLEFAPFLIPPLTSVFQQVYEMGRQGASILFEKIAWPEEEPWTYRHVLLEPRLIVRESSGTGISVPVHDVLQDH